MRFKPMCTAFTRLFTRSIASSSVVCLLAIGFSNPTQRVAIGQEAAPPAEAITVFGEAKLEVPKTWQRTNPQSSIVEHEFIAKGAADGDQASPVRITMMAAGGDVQANIDRWKTQFTGGDAAAQKAEEKKIGKWTVHLVDLSGKFQERMGGGPFGGGQVVERDGYGMTGVILVHPEGRKYFIKATGPGDAVKATRASLVTMLEGLSK